VSGAHRKLAKSAAVDEIQRLDDVKRLTVAVDRTGSGAGPASGSSAIYAPQLIVADPAWAHRVAINLAIQGRHVATGKYPGRAAARRDVDAGDRKRVQGTALLPTRATHGPQCFIQNRVIDPRCCARAARRQKSPPWSVAMLALLQRIPGPIPAGGFRPEHCATSEGGLGPGEVGLHCI